MARSTRTRKTRKLRKTRNRRGQRGGYIGDRGISPYTVRANVMRIGKDAGGVEDPQRNEE